MAEPSVEVDRMGRRDSRAPTAEKRGGLGRRPTMPVVLILAAVTVGGCSLFGRAWLGSGPKETSAPPSPNAAMDSASPGASRNGGAELIDDAASGFTLLLPPGWISLRAGDKGWVTVYGNHGTPLEQQVADGTIQAYALPLPPSADDKALNLAVYVMTCTRKYSGAPRTSARSSATSWTSRQDTPSGSAASDRTAPPGT